MSALYLSYDVKLEVSMTKKRKKRLANRFTNSVGNPMHSKGVYYGYSSRIKGFSSVTEEVWP